MFMNEDELLEKYSKLVYKVAHTYCKNTELFDDCTQEGFLALINAARTFDESRGTQFTTYATTCVRNQILGFLNGERKNTCIEIPEDTVSPEEDIDAKVTCDMLLNRLSEKSRDIVEMHYLKGYSMAEIAEVYGCTPQRICTIIQKALNKMRTGC